jgi:hypothetical protein
VHDVRHARIAGVPILICGIAVGAAMRMDVVAVAVVQRAASRLRQGVMPVCRQTTAGELMAAGGAGHAGCLRGLSARRRGAARATARTVRQAARGAQYDVVHASRTWYATSRTGTLASACGGCVVLRRTRRARPLQREPPAALDRWYATPCRVRRPGPGMGRADPAERTVLDSGHGARNADPSVTAAIADA